MSSGKIPGRPLGGFSDFFELGDVYFGAGPKKPVAIKPVAKKPAANRARNQTVKKHGQVLAAGRVTATKAVHSMTTAAQAALAKPRPLSPMKRTQVGATLAAAKAGTKPLTAKQKAALAKRDALKKKQQLAAKGAAQGAVKTRAAVITLAKALKNQKQTSAALRKGSQPTTTVRGIDLMDDAAIGEEIQALYANHYDLLGAAPDPQNPGFLDDGSVDPAYLDMADPLADPSLSLGKDAPMDTGIDLPPPPPMETFIPDAVAAGGIMYNGEKGTPDGYVGSYGLMTRTTDVPTGLPETAGIDPVFHVGYVWGRYHDNGKEGGIPFGDHLTPGAWNHVKGRYILGAFRKNALVHEGETGLSQVPAAEAFTSYKQSVGPTNYGPLIGNPKLPDFVGMRVDAKGRMFWLPQEAPEWLTFPLKQAAAITAQAAAKAAEEARKADALAAAKIQADQALAQAEQDAANALAESQAASEQKIAQAQQETADRQLTLDKARQEQEQTAADAAAIAEERRFQMEQARFDQEQLAAQNQAQREEQAFYFQQAQQEAQQRQEFLAQNPELQAQAYGYGPAPGDGGEGGYEEGGPFGEDGANHMPEDPNYDPFEGQG